MEQEEEQATLVIELEVVESSKIHAIGHDPETKTLAIQFKNFKTGQAGSTYHYANFSEEKFAEFKASESIGSYFGKNIKPEVEAHPYKKVA